MTRQKTEDYVRLFMKAWLLCEAIVHAEVSSSSPRQALVNECRDCGKVCFELATRLTGKYGDMNSLVLNSLLHCRLCSMECQKYPQEEHIQFCGIVCSLCADSINGMAREMVVFSPN